MTKVMVSEYQKKDINKHIETFKCNIDYDKLEHVNWGKWLYQVNTRYPDLQLKHKRLMVLIKEEKTGRPFKRVWSGYI